MKIALYTTGERYMSIEELEIWMDNLKKYSIECYFNCDFALSVETRSKKKLSSYCSVDDLPPEIEMIVSYGGDGTFLKCVNMFFETEIPIVGVNSGRLGFLSNVPQKEVPKFLESVVKGEYTIERRPLMYCDKANGWALNECTVQKRGLSMISLKVYIDSEYVANYLADGLIVATPTGSTAYSMSVGGAIIAPSCDCVIINPIAPHNLNVRPLVVSGSSKVTIVAESRNNDLLVTMDNMEYKYENMLEITLSRSTKKVSLVKLKDISFYKTLREKLMWGVENRNI